MINLNLIGNQLDVVFSFRLRYYSVYILLLSGAILVTAACVHFFFEIQESEDPCENNEADNNLGNV